MMGRRDPLRTGDEYDVVGWRHLYCWTQRPGVTDEVKRGIRRRERQAARRRPPREEW